MTRARDPKPNGIMLRYADAIAALMKSPRTVPELCDYADMSDWQARTLMSALQDVGVVYILEWRKPKCGALAAVYALQLSPFEKPDAPHPSANATPPSADSGQ